MVLPYNRTFYTTANSNIPTGYTNLDGGGLYISNNTTPITLYNTNTFYQIQTGWLPSYSSNVNLNTTSGTIASTATGNFNVVCSLTISTSSDLLQFQIFKNGAIVPNCTQTITPGSYTASFAYTITISGIVPLSIKDMLDVRVSSG